MSAHRFLWLPIAILAFATLVSATLVQPWPQRASAAAILVEVNTDGAPAVNGDCTLREAIQNADNDAATNPDCAAGAGDDTITFANGITLITLTAALPTITDPDGLTIDGDGDLTISGDNNDFILGTGTAAGDLTIQDIVLTNGGEGAVFNNGTLRITGSQVINSNHPDFGGGLTNGDSGTVTIEDTTFSGNSSLNGNGGSIHNEGVMTITDSNISGGAQNGGGIANERSATMEISGGTVSGTVSVSGGAIYNSASSLELTGTTVSGSLAPVEGGGIFNTGNLELTDSIIASNQASNGGGIHTTADVSVEIIDSTISGNIASTNGGGIFNQIADLTIEDSTINGNQATNSGGGITSGGGATTTITDSTISENLALLTNGGGIEIGGGNGIVTIVNSTIDGNAAAGNGGGIDNGDLATLTIIDTAISNNSTNGQGGGIFNSNDLVMSGSTVSGNESVNGGGVLNTFTVDPDRFLAINSTFSGNKADYGGAIYNGEQGIAALVNVTVTANLAAQEGGGLYAPNDISSSFVLHNTIVADQTTNSDCDALPSQILSLGNNLDSSNQCDLDQPTDKPQVDVFLGPLTDNGGPTRTHALMPNSQALDSGNDESCAAEPINGVDQRGVTRLHGPHCDIGAYEFESGTATPTASPTPTLTPISTATPTASSTPSPTPSSPETATPTDTAVPTDTPTPSASPSGVERIWGDVDCDGEVSTRDNQAVLRAVLEQQPLSQTEPCPDIGDAVVVDGATIVWGNDDCDGDISTRDNQATLRFVLEQAPLAQTEPCPNLGSTVQVID